MKKFLLAVLILLALPSLTTAQTNTTADVDTIGQTQCTAVLNTNMRYRMRDSQTNNEVSALQDFLNVEGYLASQPTGFFGLATLNAVKKFQSASGFVATGYVGPLTRAKINAMSCGTGVTATPTQYTSVPTPQVSTRPIPPTQSSLPTGCSSTVGFSVTTGNRCNTPATPTISNFPAGCTSNIGYSSTTGQKCSAVIAVVPEVPVVATDIATADLKVNGSDGPLTLSLNQQVFLSWKTTGMRSCTLGNVNENPSNGTDTSISPIPLSGSMYAYYTGYNPAIMLSCFKTTDGSVSSGGDIVKLTYAPVPVATSTQMTTAYAITSISEIYPSYVAGAPISIQIKTIGGEGDGTPATSDKGYNIQAYVFNASDTGFANYLTPNPAYSYNGTYNASTGYWSVQMNAPSTPGSYNLRVVLYCSRFGTTCYNAGGHGTESVKIIPFTVQGAVTTAVPTVEVIGSPKLALQYDSTNKESALTASYTLKAMAPAGSDFKLYKYGAFDADMYAFLVSLSNAKNANGWQSNGNYYLVSGNVTDNGTHWVIPGGQTATFNLTANMPNPNALFAGSYNATLSIYKPAGGSTGATAAVVTGNTTTNTVTIIGERAPYLTGATQPTSAGQPLDIVQITGVRFASYGGNTVVFNGTRFTPEISASDIGPILMFAPSKYGVTGSGVYPVQVITAEGASNAVNVNILGSSVATTAAITSPLTVMANTPFTVSGTASPAGSVIEFLFGNNGGSGSALVLSNGTWSMYWGGTGLSAGSYPITISSRSSSGATGAVLATGTLVVGSPSFPTVEFIGTPTLTLQYDSVGKEAALVGTAVVKVTAGSLPVAFNALGGAGKSVYFSLYNATRGESSGNYASSDSPALIPAGTSLTFTTTVSQTVKTLFAGAYTLVPEGLQYYVDGTYLAIPKSSLVNAVSSSPVTIIGETSPYITSAVADSSGVVGVVAWRLTSSSTVSFGGGTAVLPSAPSGSLWVMSFKPSQFGVISAGTYPLQISTSEGASNIVYVNVSAPVAQAPASTQYASVIGSFATVPTQQAPAVVPTSTFEYAWDRNLEVNSPYADDISALQTALTKEGVYNGEVTGGFYAQTYTAVKEFQTKYGIESTGFVGPATRAKLDELY